MKKILLVLLIIIFFLSNVQASKIKQIIEFTNSAGATSGGYNSEGIFGMTDFDISDYDGTVEVYLEVVFDMTFSGVPNGIPEAYADLWDVNNSQEVTDSEIWCGIGRHRSPDISNYFNTYGKITIFPRFRAGNEDTWVYVHAMRLIIIQSGTITKTATYIPIGDSEQPVFTTYSGIRSPKRWDYDSGDYSGNLAVYFGATLSAENPSYTTHAILYDKDISAGILGSEFSTSSDPPIYIESGDISGNLSNGNTLDVYLKYTVGKGYIRNAFLIIKQTNIPQETGKLKTVMQETNFAWSTTGTVYHYYGDSGFKNEYDPNDWSDCDLTSEGEYMLKAIGRFKTGYARLTDDASEISGSIESTTSAAYTQLNTGILTLPASASEIDSETKGSDATAGGGLSSARLILIITNLGTTIELTAPKDSGEIIFVNGFPTLTTTNRYIYLLLYPIFNMLGGFT